MASIFLDTNKILDFAGRKPESFPDTNKNEVFISIASIPTVAYLKKVHLPHDDFKEFVFTFNLVELDETILKLAFSGPTSDVEDNIQLHSAVRGDCDVFLTSDKKLLSMKFFGKMRVLDGMRDYEG